MPHVKTLTKNIASDITLKYPTFSHPTPRPTRRSFHPPPANDTITMKRAKVKAPAAAGSFGGFGAPAGGSTLSYLAEPPSFSAISDPNLVVALKNILKKDATTKAKGLEELVAQVQKHPFEQDGGIEEALLDVWVSVLLTSIIISS